MSLTVRLALPIAAILLVAPSLRGDNPFVKKSKPTVQDIEANLGNHLGNRTTVWGWLLPTTRTSGTGIELTVQADAKSPASRIRFLAPKSLAEPIAALKDGRRVQITGTVLAAESVRMGYTFEVEEIAVLDSADGVTATLKPTAGPLPVAEPEKVEAAAPASEKPAGKSSDAGKKAGGSVPTVLIVIAVAMALMLGVLGVIGVRLIKKMNANGTTNREKSPAQYSAQA